MTAKKPISFFIIAFASIFMCNGQEVPAGNQSYDAGVAFLKEGNYAAAILEFDNVLAGYEQDKDALYNRGVAKFRMQDTLSACADWSAAAYYGDTSVYPVILKYCHGLIVFDGDTVTVQQSRMKDTSRVYEIVEVMPQFPGGEQALMRFISENIKYPDDAKSNRMQGRVYVTFVVGKSGAIEEASILKGTGNSLEGEALRVISRMPPWNPGMQNGKPVRVKYNLPINFQLK